MAEYAGFVEGYAARRSKVTRYVWTRAHRFLKGGERGIADGIIRRRARESVAEALGDLEQRQIDGGQPIAHDVRGAGEIFLHHAFEIAEEFRQAVVEEGLRAGLGGPLLV